MLVSQRPRLWSFFLWSFFLFCLLVPVWGYLSPLYTQLLAACAQRLILSSLPRGELEPGWAVGLKTQGNTITLTNPFASSRVYLAGFSATRVHGNVPLLLALFLVTPGVSAGRRVRRLGWALGVLFLWQVGHTVFLVKLLESQGVLYASLEQVEVARSVLRMHVPNILLGVFAPQLLPFLLWVGFLGFYQPGEGGISGKVGRNDPCPCGSGRKYKRCCGGR